MKKYIVIRPFYDTEDDNYLYDEIGAFYPREGLNTEDISQKRINDLLTCGNKQKRPVIKTIEIEPAAGENENTNEIEPAVGEKKRKSSKK